MRRTAQPGREGGEASYSEDVREKIIKASMHVFSKYGFFRAPVRLIAMEADVSKGLVFWYFRSKDELILEVAHRSLPADIIEECLSRELKGVELLRCIGRGYLDKYRDEVLKNLLFHTLSSETVYPRIREEVRKICKERVQSVAARVFGSAEPRYRVAVRSFFGALLCYVLRPPPDIPAEKYVELLISQMPFKHQSKSP